ncbi:MAG: calcium-binding protein, partial [Pseudomonadota bacterium]
GGIDTLRGDEGSDSLAGGTGADTLDGGEGFDWADYSGSNNGVTVNLGDGSPGSGGHAAGDTLVSIEAVEGSDFNDFLTGDDADNTLNGGDRNDVLAGGAGADTLDGGAGTDWAHYDTSDAAVVINLDDGAPESGGHAEGDTLTGIERILGSAFGDTITGDGGSNTILGAGGADILDGGLGNDILSGGAGADMIDGGGGRDWAFYDTSSSGVVVDLSDGLAESGGDAQGDTLSDIEAVLGSAHDDTLIGNSASNYLGGGSGNDTLSGGAGRDILRGDAGDDTMTGGDGGDTFFFATSGGDDTITDFEDGIDVIRMDSSIASFSDLVISDQGADTLVSFAGSTITLEGLDHTSLTSDDFAFS